MNKTSMEKYFLTVTYTPATPHNDSTEFPPSVTDANHNPHDTELFIYGLLFLAVLMVTMAVLKLYKRCITCCIPEPFPGGIRLDDDEVEEVVVYREELETMLAPIYQIDAQNNVISEENQVLKKNK